MRHTLIDAQFIYKRTGQCKVNILLVVPNSYNRCKFFYDTGKHNC